MSEHHFDATITLHERAAGDLEKAAMAADRAVWNDAAGALRERVYRTEAGIVRLRAGWDAATAGPTIRLPLQVVDEREAGDDRDVPAFVELFFHDLFLLFNIAVPGSLGGVMTAAGGDLRIREVALDAYIFECAWVAASRDGRLTIAPLPLADVVRWYDALQLGTQQLATSGGAKALFHLLHLARGAESEAMAILRLAHSIEALFGRPIAPADAFTLREVIVGDTVPVVHPMHDDALDARLESGAFDWTDAADLAAAIVVTEIQSRVRGG